MVDKKNKSIDDWKLMAGYYVALSFLIGIILTIYAHSLNDIVNTAAVFWYIVGAVHIIGVIPSIAINFFLLIFNRTDSLFSFYKRGLIFLMIIGIIIVLGLFANIFLTSYVDKYVQI